MPRKHTHNDIVRKFYANIIETKGGCWEWQRYRDSLGYGKISVHGKVKNAHRFAWELLRGSIPEGLVIDHLCKNTCCCNPIHLRVTTNRVNVLASNAPPAINARKTHCPRGHEYIPENIDWVDKTNQKGRQCKKCRLKFKGLGWRKTLAECKHGHPFDEANTYYRVDKRNGKTYRMCRTCHKLSQRRRYKRVAAGGG